MSEKKIHMHQKISCKGVWSRVKYEKYLNEWTHCCVCKWHLQSIWHLHSTVIQKIIGVFFCFTITDSNMRIQCVYNQTMKNISSVATWIPILLFFLFEMSNSSPEAISYINTGFSSISIFTWQKHTGMHTHSHTNLSKNTGQKSTIKQTKSMHFSPGSSISLLPCDAAHCSV